VTAGRSVLAKSQHLANADVQLHGAMLDVLLKISCHTRLKPQQKQHNEQLSRSSKTGETSRNESQPLYATRCVPKPGELFLATRGNRLRT